jgi:hypothetical protein
LWTHLFFAELFASPTGERKVRAAVRAGGCTLLLRQSRASQYIPVILASSNKGWQRRWFNLRNDGELLPPFSQRVVTAATNAWRHGTPHERQKNLGPLLQALEALREGGLTAAGVIAAIHRRRVLPLAERRLSLWEMTPEADWEGSRMSPDPLPFDALQWRVSAALGKPDPQAFSQLRMRPDQGCVTLVSVRSFLLHTLGCSWFLRSGFFPPFLQEVGWHKPSRPRVPEDAVDRAARRVAAEKKKKKKDAEKARARERRRARDALEKRRRQQEREGLPREPSPETPDDDDGDDDEEEDDMAARLGLSPGLGCGQEPSSQPPSGPTPSVPGVGASGSQPEARGQPEGAPDPSAGGAKATPGGQVRASAPQEPPLVSAAHGGDPQVIMTVPGQSAPRASKARVAPKLPAKQTSAAVPGAGIQETSPQARWIMARSG